MSNTTVRSGSGYEILNNRGTDTTSVSFRESSNAREIYVIAHVDKTDSGAWFDAKLLRDGSDVKHVRTHTNHNNSAKDFDLTYNVRGSM